MRRRRVNNLRLWVMSMPTNATSQIYVDSVEEAVQLVERLIDRGLDWRSFGLEVLVNGRLEKWEDEDGWDILSYFYAGYPE